MGGPYISRRSNFFQGGGGVEMLICIETNRTCDFPGVGGGVGPLSSLWIRTMIRVVTKIFRLLHSKYTWEMLSFCLH